MMAAAMIGGAEERSSPGPRLLWRVQDGGGLLGALVIDQLVAGRACGGLRVAPAVTVTELRELAAVMTLKFAFFGIACGGAKAGLLVPEGETAEKRARKTLAFGRALAPLFRFGTYIPGADLGCSERDLWDLLSGAGLTTGPPPPRRPAETLATAAYSGRSAAIAAIAALGGQVEGATLSVLGYGRVGAALAARFTAAGGRLVAVSTARGAVVEPAGLDLDRLERARAIHGEEAPLHYPDGRRVAPGEVLGLPVDVLAPCATARMLDAASCQRARCRVVAAGANAAVTLEAEARLAAAGITVLPDFVANAGGILVSHFWPLPLPAAAVDHLLERRFRTIVEGLLTRAALAGVTPPELARRFARRNLERLARDHRSAVRHERLIARLGRGPLRELLPGAFLTAFVAHVARALGPPRG